MSQDWKEECNSTGECRLDELRSLQSAVAELKQAYYFGTPNDLEVAFQKLNRGR